MAHSGILEQMTIREVQDLAPNVGLIPIGSTEPHGPALPYGTDAFVAEAVAYGAVRQANEQGARAVCLPVQRISLNNNFRQLPFACRVSVPTFMAMLTDLVEFLGGEGVSRIVILNTHGGNPEVIKATLRHLARHDAPFVCLYTRGSGASAAAWRQIEHPSDHAGESEASQMLHLHPDWVHEDRLGDYPTHQADCAALRGDRAYWVRPWHRYMPAACGGEARQATADKGRALIEAEVAGLAEFLVELSLAGPMAEFPYA